MEKTYQKEQQNEQQLYHQLYQNFPFKPYNIQLDFSQALFRCLEKQIKFSIFESPTGTGKSMSLIVGCLTWLKENEFNFDKLFKENKNDKTTQDDNDDTPDWAKQVQTISKESFLHQLQQEKSLMKDKLTMIKNLKSSFKHYKDTNKKQQEQVAIIKQEKDQDQKYIADYSSEEEIEKGEIDNFGVKSLYQGLYSNLEKSIFKRQKRQLNVDNNNYQEDLPRFKIIYASRTHSQIKQFVNEIKKTNFKDFRVITLGSRQNLCINHKVNCPQHTAYQINDLCKEITQYSCSKSQKKSDQLIDKKCKYYETAQQNDEELNYLLFQNIVDIEEIKHIGEVEEACPYYLSKRSVQKSQIICLPYTSLIDKGMRDSLSIDIKNSIIIFDEAHNLLEAVSQMHTKELTFRQITYVNQNLNNYLSKYQNRFKQKNILYIQQLISLSAKLIELIQKNNTQQFGQINNKQSEHSYEKINLIQFLIQLDLDKIDMFKIFKFIEKSRFCEKVHFYNLKHQININKNDEHQIDTNYQKDNAIIKLLTAEELNEILSVKEHNVIQQFIDFFQFCMFENQDDSIIIIKNSPKLPQVSIKILNLNYYSHVTKIIEEAYSVILAGGTMEPLSDFNQIFNQIGQQECFHFSCDHIISQNNFQALTIEKIKGNTLLFNYNNKNKDQYLFKNSCIIIQQLSKSIPDGLVVFVQSYGTLQKIKEELQSIKVEKPIFFDQKEDKDLFDRYQLEIRKKQRGAILISVIGGKLSEGINFSDDLARCILVLGLPYSNFYSPELQERMKYYDQNSNCQKQISQQKMSGQEYYDNLCAKALNQTIGRCIRHINDYALIVLVDSRFSQQKLTKKLPRWIQSKLKNYVDFESIESDNIIQQFFSNR